MAKGTEGWYQYSGAHDIEAVTYSVLIVNSDSVSDSNNFPSQAAGAVIYNDVIYRFLSFFTALLSKDTPHPPFQPLTHLSTSC